MLLTITSTAPNASDLGYLLHKNPSRAQSFNLTFGAAHVFYPEASDTRCTAALLLEVDPVALVRGRKSTNFQYVNDRPYVASSFTSVALGEVFGTALAGRCKQRPELVRQPLPIEVRVSAVPCRGGEPILRRLFEPLGYQVQAELLPLDTEFPDWGTGNLFRLCLTITTPLVEVLRHLYVLLPTMDSQKHYFVGDDEVAKLLRRGEGWLGEHPDQELIARRYLKMQRDLTRQAMARLRPEPPCNTEEPVPCVTPERKVRLAVQRMDIVTETIVALSPRSVLDLGCGEGWLLKRLLSATNAKIIGVDVSTSSLERAADRLKLDRMPAAKRARLTLIQGSCVYRDMRFENHDVIALIEVIEHIDLSRLEALERVVFGAAAPKHVVLTTPNQEYNQLWPSLPFGDRRHRDHRFEWTRAEFQDWAHGVAERHGYSVVFQGIGPEDETYGTPTQMAVFSSAGEVQDG